MADISIIINSIVNVAFWSLLALLVGGTIFFIYWWFSFKNGLELREVINNRKIIKNYRWKEKRDKNNNIWLITPFWNMWKMGLKLQIPPSDAVELTAKGKKKVIGWNYDGNIIWAKDNFNFKDYKEDVVGVGFQPLDTTDRELLVHELVKSKEYEGKNLWASLVQIAIILAPIILVIVIGLTLGEITEALGTYADKITSIAESDGLTINCGSQQVANPISSESYINASTPPG